jgi:hypothetical protein
MNKSSYPYRIKRFSQMQKDWNLDKIHDLMLSHTPNEQLLKEFKNSVMQYIAKSFYFDVTFDENEFLNRLESNKNIKDNITPNGAVVPKKEYQLEFNLDLIPSLDIEVKH